MHREETGASPRSGVALSLPARKVTIPKQAKAMPRRIPIGA
jgi:hypothetical protein